MRLVDKEAAKAELLRVMGDVQAYGAYFEGIRDAYQSAADRLDTLPVVEERKHGHWIDIDFDTSICSMCKNPQEIETTYCPNCGAKMEGE